MLFSDNGCFSTAIYLVSLHMKVSTVSKLNILILNLPCPNNEGCCSLHMCFFGGCRFYTKNSSLRIRVRDLSALSGLKRNQSWSSKKMKYNFDSFFTKKHNTACWWEQRERDYENLKSWPFNFIYWKLLLSCQLQSWGWQRLRETDKASALKGCLFNIYADDLQQEK